MTNKATGDKMYYVVESGGFYSPDEKYIYVPKGTKATNGIAALFTIEDKGIELKFCEEDSCLESALFSLWESKIVKKPTDCKTIKSYPIPRVIAEYIKTKNKLKNLEIRARNEISATIKGGN